MTRQCSRGHDGTKPVEDADDTSARHNTAPEHDIIKGKVRQLREKLEVAMAETLDAGAEETGKQSARSHGQAGAPLRDLPDAPHLDG
jgi:hypothetical protein